MHGSRDRVCTRLATSVTAASGTCIIASPRPLSASQVSHRCLRHVRDRFASPAFCFAPPVALTLSPSFHAAGLASPWLPSLALLLKWH